MRGIVKTNTVACSVTPALHDAIRRIARHELCSVSDLLRRALIDLSRSHGINPLEPITDGDLVVDRRAAGREIRA